MQDRENNEMELSLRARENRLSDTELSASTRLPSDEAVVSPEIGRLSRRAHVFEEKSALEHQEKTYDMGHIPMTPKEEAQQIEIESLNDQPVTSEVEIQGITNYELRTTNESKKLDKERNRTVSNESQEIDAEQESKGISHSTDSTSSLQASSRSSLSLRTQSSESKTGQANFQLPISNELQNTNGEQEMHIPVSPHKKPKKSEDLPQENSSKKSIAGEIFKFALTSASIFLLVFAGLNFESYSILLDDYLHPEKNAERSEELRQTLEQKPRLDRVALLPVAGIERQDPPPKLKSFLSVAPLDNRLIIEKIGRNVPIVSGIGYEELLNEDWEGLESKIQLALKDGVVHYPATAEAGEVGNFFLTGHSSFYFWDNGKYKDVFALLGKLEVGDTYTVYYDQKKYVYKIFEERIVPPEDTSVLNQPTDQKIGTLMTCWPPGTVTYRKIYRSHQIEPAP